MLPDLRDVSVGRYPPDLRAALAAGVEIGQVVFVLLSCSSSFRQLEIRWPRWVEALPG